MFARRRGFTLIELLIVVVIIGILASIAIPKFGNTKRRAYIAAMASDLKSLQVAQESYFSENNAMYAATVTALGTAFKSSSGVVIVIGGVTGSGWRATATHALAAGKRCRTAVGSTRSYDAVVVCS
jgi:prepilin-type N-terminal cleavage/methylation domain-containing protein